MSRASPSHESYENGQWNPFEEDVASQQQTQLQEVGEPNYSSADLSVVYWDFFISFLEVGYVCVVYCKKYSTFVENHQLFCCL